MPPNSLVVGWCGRPPYHGCNCHGRALQNRGLATAQGQHFAPGAAPHCLDLCGVGARLARVDCPTAVGRSFPSDWMCLSTCSLVPGCRVRRSPHIICGQMPPTRTCVHTWVSNGRYPLSPEGGWARHSHPGHVMGGRVAMARVTASRDQDSHVGVT